ncbi:hypothetical protein D8M04_15750 [Oceanobacillus piezotolerans]|uniref:Uncharacterized protein n=1 Tax=Oceanobacillus piezotolerans TaxID=2448030 RepID=A0A498D7V3_9BACI|nr:hypothetical protein [Oceanobacillus piezotolerans]RLL42037.1 hypothetical protein D8M04_15750 [Oceanobacillus piezotolerans]
MKHYWKLISIILFFVLVIGTFYVREGVADNAYPEFSIQTVSGDKMEIANLSLDGEYRNSQTGLGDWVEITHGGSTYVTEISFFEQATENYVHQPLKRLIEEYRGFMRGKWHGGEYFFENEQLIAYADISSERSNSIGVGDLNFEIEVLDKESDQTKSIEMVVPEQENYQYMRVAGVQVTGSYLQVITYSETQDRTIEYLMYTFDIDDLSLINQETIFASERPEQDGNTWVEVNLENDYEDIGPVSYLVFSKEVIETIPLTHDPSSGYEERIVEGVLLAYSVETGEKKEIELPETLIEQMNNGDGMYDMISVHESSVYFGAMTENGIEVTPYQLEEEAFGEKQTFNYITTLEMEDDYYHYYPPQFVMEDSKLYFADPHKDKEKDVSVYVADLKTGETLYEGSIEIEGANIMQLGHELYIYGLEVE